METRIDKYFFFRNVPEVAPLLSGMQMVIAGETGEKRSYTLELTVACRGERTKPGGSGLSPVNPCDKEPLINHQVKA
jgi:hypothetical protein